MGIYPLGLISRMQDLIISNPIVPLPDLVTCQILVSGGALPFCYTKVVQKSCFQVFQVSLFPLEFFDHSVFLSTPSSGKTKCLNMRIASITLIS